MCLGFGELKISTSTSHCLNFSDLSQWDKHVFLLCELIVSLATRLSFTTTFPGLASYSTAVQLFVNYPCESTRASSELCCDTIQVL